MAEIVNLRRVRKRLARAIAEREAEENRAKFGRAKGERVAEASRRDKADRDLDAKRIEDQ